MRISGGKVQIPNGGRITNQTRLFAIGRRGAGSVVSYEIRYPFTNAINLRKLVREFLQLGIGKAHLLDLLEKIERAERADIPFFEVDALVSSSKRAMMDYVRFLKNTPDGAERRIITIRYGASSNRVFPGADIRVAYIDHGRSKVMKTTPAGRVCLDEHLRAVIAIAKRYGYTVSGANVVSRLASLPQLLRAAGSTRHSMAVKGSLLVGLPDGRISYPPSVGVHLSGSQDRPQIALWITVSFEYSNDSRERTQRLVEQARRAGFKITGERYLSPETEEHRRPMTRIAGPSYGPKITTVSPEQFITNLGRWRGNYAIIHLSGGTAVARSHRGTHMRTVGLTGRQRTEIVDRAREYGIPVKR